MIEIVDKGLDKFFLIGKQLMTPLPPQVPQKKRKKKNFYAD